MNCKKEIHSDMFNEPTNPKSCIEREEMKKDTKLNVNLSIKCLKINKNFEKSNNVSFTSKYDSLNEQDFRREMKGDLYLI